MTQKHFRTIQCSRVVIMNINSYWNAEALANEGFWLIKGCPDNRELNILVSKKQTAFYSSFTGPNLIEEHFAKDLVLSGKLKQLFIYRNRFTEMNTQRMSVSVAGPRNKDKSV